MEALERKHERWVRMGLYDKAISRSIGPWEVMAAQMDLVNFKYT